MPARHAPSDHESAKKLKIEPVASRTSSLVKTSSTLSGLGIGIGMMEFCRAAVRESACLLRPSLSLSFDFGLDFSSFPELSFSFEVEPSRVRPAEEPVPLGLTALSSAALFADDDTADEDSVSSFLVDLRRPASSDISSADGNGQKSLSKF